MGLLDSLTFNGLLAFFGNKENAVIAAQLQELMIAAGNCSSQLERKLELCESNMIEDEHRGDEAVKKIGEAIERGFSVRFGKGDPARLAHELDDVIDGMRDVARHIETYRTYLDPFSFASVGLIRTVQSSVEYLKKMIADVVGGAPDMNNLNSLSAKIDALEQEADWIRARAEQELASHIPSSIEELRRHIALNKLNDLLEVITDHAKRCAVLVLAMVRQEA